MEANNLRKTQRKGNELWHQPLHPMGDLPWLNLEYNSSNTNRVHSTPNLCTDSSSHQNSSAKLSSKSLIQFSPDVSNKATHKLVNRKGFTISEPAQLNLHSGTALPTSSPCTHYGSPSGFTSNSVHLDYTTTVDQHTMNLTHMSDEPEMQSPTTYYSANKASTEDDVVEPGVVRQSSSSLFIPRGFSSGPQNLIPARSSPIERLLRQLSGESGQEDQAPELEMDMYDIHV